MRTAHVSVLATLYFPPTRMTTGHLSRPRPHGARPHRRETSTAPISVAATVAAVQTPALPARDPVPRRWAAAVAVLAMTLSACSGAVRLSTGDPIELVRTPQTSRVLSSSGAVVAELHGEEDREDVALEEVADELVQAVVAIEDRRFFLHAGVDVPAIARAFAANVEAGEIEQGGSTLTQQYVKNTITGNAETIERKVQEAALAFQLEQQLGKDEILERYLNTVYFGAGAYGVAAASRTFFGIEPDDVDLAQAALLAGLIRSPSALDPFQYPDRATARRSLVLDAMVDVGVVDAEEAAAADDAPLDLRPPPPPEADPNGWFLDEVRRRVINDDRFTAIGPTPDDRVDALFTGGLRIHTTLDEQVQALTGDAVDAVLTEQDDPAAAIVVLEPATGAVRAIYGGPTEDRVAAGFSLATQGRRQPGSSFKPIVLAAALDRGVPLDRVFPGGACASFASVPDWSDGVCNYANASYGPLTLREATVRSVNTVYARLGVELGPNAMLAQARTMGITSDLPAVHALALGAGEVTPFELASAYSSFATLGTWHEPHLVTRITDADGTVLWEQPDEPIQVLDEGVAHFVTRTLEEVTRRGTGVNAQIGRPQAGKTGTSQDSADAWFVGYTPDLLASVWVGFPEGRVPMVPPRTREVVEGGRYPARIWAALMEPALATIPPTPFAQPQTGVQVVEVDVTRNCLPNPYTPADVIEAREYPAGAAPTERCTEPTGPPVDDVPDVTGLPLDVALARLAEGGFAVDQRPMDATLYPVGFVERQRPGPGGSTLPEDGNAVVLWISTNTGVRVTVPDVIGLRGADAVAALQDLGFVVDVRTGCLDPEACGASGAVEAMTPGPGERTDEHAVVELLVAP